MADYRQCLIGIASNNFVIIAADQTDAKSIFILRDDEDKIHEISDSLMVGLAGEAGETSQFIQFIKYNLALYTVRNGYSLDTAPAVSFIRKSLTDTLRGQNPPMLNILVAGYDAGVGCQLHYLDFLATSVRVPYACTGFGGTLSLAIVDEYYKYNMTETEAYEVLKLCCNEIQKRLIFSLPKFCVKVMSKNGIHELPPILMSVDDAAGV